MTTEIIKFDPKDGFYVAVIDIEGKELSRKELSAWGLTKQVETFAIAKRVIPSLNPESATREAYYKIPLKFAIQPNAKEYYLVTTNVFRDDWQKIIGVYLRNVDTGETQSISDCDLSVSQFWQVQDICQVSIGKKTRISKEQAVELLKSYQSIGLRSEDLTRKFV
jgi:phage terminase large subunit GpA-like protein